MSEIARTLARVDGKVYVALPPEERDRYDAYVQALLEHEDELHEGCRSETEVEALESQISDLEDEVDIARIEGFDEAIDRVIAGAQHLKETGPKKEQTT